MAKTMEHLSDFVFVTVANSAYLSHLKSGIKPDTLAALRSAPLQMTNLFPDEVLKQTEQDIATFESKNQPFSNKKGRFHLYERTEKRSDKGNQTALHGRILDTVVKARKAGAGPHTTLHDRPRGSSHTDDNQCVISPVKGLLPGSLKTVKHVQFTQDIKFSDTRQFNCKLKCCWLCTFCERAITKERCKSHYCTNLQREIKVCEKCFLCRSRLLQVLYKMTNVLLKIYLSGQDFRIFGRLGWIWVPVRKLFKS